MGIDISAVNIQTIKAMLQPDCIKLTCELLQELFEERRQLMYDIVEDDIEEILGETHVGEANVV